MVIANSLGNLVWNGLGFLVPDTGALPPGVWTASGSFLDVTPQGMTSHIYVPWCSAYSGPSYISDEYKQGAVYILSGVRYSAYQEVNNIWLSQSAGSNSSNSSIDLRLEQGFKIGCSSYSDTFTMSADFSSDFGASHRYGIRQLGTLQEWYGPYEGWSVDTFSAGTTHWESSHPSSLTTGSGIIGPACPVVSSVYMDLPMRPFVSSQRTGSGFWTASGQISI